MRTQKSSFKHPPEVRLAIIREHRECPLRMAELLQRCGWSLGDAACAAVNWDIMGMAEAIADEREKRGAKLTNLSDADLAKLKEEIEMAAKKPPDGARSKKTNRIGQTTSRLTPRIPKKPADPPT